MIEVLKQVVMTLDFLLYGDNPDYDEACKTLEVGKHAIAELESQEPVALPCCGYTDASAVKWNPFNGIVQCHNCGQTYTAPPQRTEQNFCSRCGKRTKDIHTCTPPQEKT